MINFIVIVIIAILLGGAMGYIVREKKRGVKCIGCPAASACGKKHDGTDGCGCECHSE